MIECAASEPAVTDMLQRMNTWLRARLPCSSGRMLYVAPCTCRRPCDTSSGDRAYGSMHLPSPKRHQPQ